MVLPEEFGWPQHIGALGILDGSHLLEADGRFPIEAVRERIGRRLYLLPRFRQLLYTPRRGLGWPPWVDAPAFTIAGHVGVFPHAAPAGEAQLLAACEELRQRRLDRSRPLWQMWFLPGLAEARVGLVMKVHHAIADGVAGVAAFGAFLDLRADAPGPAPATMDTSALPLRARAAARQPAPAGARVPWRPVRAGPPGRHRARDPAGVAGGTRDVHRGACPTGPA